MSVGSRYQKRHYQDLAPLIAEAERQARSGMAATEVVARLRRDLARLFARDNAQFDAERWAWESWESGDGV